MCGTSCDPAGPAHYYGGVTEMGEIERYESDIPMRVVVLQTFGHGPVYIRCPGLTRAKCVHPGCMWAGPDRYGPDMGAQMEADALAHLDMTEDDL